MAASFGLLGRTSRHTEFNYPNQNNQIMHYKNRLFAHVAHHHHSQCMVCAPGFSQNNGNFYYCIFSPIVSISLLFLLFSSIERVILFLSLFFFFSFFILLLLAYPLPAPLRTTNKRKGPQNENAVYKIHRLNVRGWGIYIISPHSSILPNLHVPELSPCALRRVWS